MEIYKMSSKHSHTLSFNDIPDNVRSVQLATNKLTTQINCVIRVLQESIEIVKISLILPYILENPSEARIILKGTKYETALALLDDYMLRRDIIIREKKPPLSDHSMIKIIDYFQQHYKMYKLFPKLLQKLPFQDKYFLITFERLYNICEHHLLRSAKKEISTERQLHTIYQENEIIKKNILKLKEDLTNQVVQERWKMAAKLVYLQKCEGEIIEKRQQNRERMRNESENCQRIILMNRKCVEEEIVLLEEEFKTLQVDFDKQVKSNRREMQSLRSEKNKLELQLQASIKKYDSTISQKMIKHMDHEEELAKSKKELEKVMVEYHKSEAIYNDIVVKYENDEVLRLKRRILTYMMNRAARKIQKYWRKWHKVQYRKTRLEQKKLKKLKKRY